MVQHGNASPNLRHVDLKWWFANHHVELGHVAGVALVACFRPCSPQARRSRARGATSASYTTAFQRARLLHARRRWYCCFGRAAAASRGELDATLRLGDCHHPGERGTVVAGGAVRVCAPNATIAWRHYVAVTAPDVGGALEIAVTEPGDYELTGSGELTKLGGFATTINALQHQQSPLHRGHG